jgi:hypothetical protein
VKLSDLLNHFTEKVKRLGKIGKGDATAKQFYLNARDRLVKF